MAAITSDEGTKCGICGSIDGGNYCSQCGCRLTSEKPHPFIAFAHTHFNLAALKEYVATYFTIACSPTRNTMHLVNDPNYTGHYSFLSISITLHFALILFGAEEAAQKGAHPLALVIGLAASIYAMYWLCYRKSKAHRTIHEFVKLASLSYGFAVTTGFVSQVIAMNHTRPGWNLILTSTIGVLVSIYIARVSKQFWEISMRKALLYYFTSYIIILIAVYALAAHVIELLGLPL